MEPRTEGRNADGRALVAAARVASETEGRIVQGVLSAHGVVSTLVGRESSGYGAGASPLNRLRVLVLADDLDAAREVLEAPLEDAPDQWSRGSRL